MSIESAKAFLERMKNDEDFRTSVGEIATSEERLEYVKKAGFDFTKEEITTLKDELSDEVLKSVSGGKTPTCILGGGDAQCHESRTCKNKECVEHSI